ncbi:MAG: hypothetical protein ACOZIN_01745 [Myxococcota bacterium]
MGSTARRMLLALGAAVAGGLLVIGVGQLFARVGGSCSLLCRPEVAGTLGALGGLFGVLSGPRRSDPE